MRRYVKQKMSSEDELTSIESNKIRNRISGFFIHLDFYFPFLETNFFFAIFYIFITFVNIILQFVKHKT